MKAVYSEFTIKLSTTSLFGVLRVQKRVDGLLSGTARACKNADMKNVRLLLRLRVNKSVMNDSNHSPGTNGRVMDETLCELGKRRFFLSHAPKTLRT